MKNLFSTFLLTLISFYTFSQNEKNSDLKTKIENILSSKGEVIHKEYEDFFEIKPSNIEYIEFKKLKVTSLKSNLKTYGLYIYGMEFRTNGLSRDGYTFIDQNEIVGLYDFLNFVLEKVKKVETNYTEYVLNTNDLQVSLFNSKVDPKRTFPKEELSYNYWILTFNVGNINSFRFKVKNINDIIPLVEKLKELKFE
ncbi:hypothetical protein [Aquirufa rosea]|uniref:Uncharacterized protein n=1 Tax=Aquirufa rosea TaxID=2509241 RepID=A0A4Q1BYR4_9BACT|nr:hypothetical protein [Aquirufa rosea]RXK48254.1 hypothetical protein ESB04_09425 [Aquirufa rosea]